MWFGALWGVVVLGWTVVAVADDCGTGIATCKCGDVVVTSTVLTADVGPCTGTALEVKSAVVLDCAFRAVTGTGKDTPAWYGIHVDASGAEIKNCRVTGFKRGIRIAGGKGNRIVNNESYSNWTYAIEIAGGSTDNLIQGNQVGKPNAAKVTRPDEGIHNGSNSHRTQIRDNVVIDSRAEGIYILKSNGVQITGNAVSEIESAGIFVKHSHGAYVAGNTVTNGSITVRGDSSGNVFENNTIASGRGYLFEAFQDKDDDPSPGYWTFPRRNTVIGGKVVTPIVLPNTNPPILPCLRFEGSYKNSINQLALDPTCTPPSQTPDGGQESVGNVITTIPLP